MLKTGSFLSSVASYIWWYKINNWVMSQNENSIQRKKKKKRQKRVDIFLPTPLLIYIAGTSYSENWRENERTGKRERQWEKERKRERERNEKSKMEEQFTWSERVLR
jgi:hypothetical protein